MYKSALVLILGMLAQATAWGHGSAMAVFKCEQTAPDSYSILWKTNQAAAAATLDAVTFPASCSRTHAPVRQAVEGTVRTRAGLLCTTASLGIVKFPQKPAGLHVMVEARFQDGTRFTKLVRDGDEVEIAPNASAGVLGTVLRYGIIGVEHILLGVDHLLFVLGLLLLVQGRRGLIYAITAFTIAHSLTLALCVLDIVRLKPEPVEAVIALSIVLLAREAMSQKETISSRLPWLVAFGFGLLHGLGFAGALLDIGLPTHDLPVALLSFNVGVEVGQLFFVALVWQLQGHMRKRSAPWIGKIRSATAYAMGGVAMFWVFERVEAIFSLS